MNLSKRSWSPKQLSEFLRDGTFGLPDFQRPSVWKPKQQLKLLDSLRKGLPIGMITVWAVPSRPRVRNQRPFFPTSEHSSHEYLVLDGQQRLRALAALCSVVDPYDTKQRSIVVNRQGQVVARRIDPEQASQEYAPTSLAAQGGFHERRDLTFSQRDTLRAIGEVINADSIQVVEVPLRHYSSAVELFERINSLGTRLAEKDLVAARLTEGYPEYITQCEKVSSDLTQDGLPSRLACFDRMVVTKSVAFAATKNRTAKAKLSQQLIRDAMHGKKVRKPPIKKYLAGTRKAGTKLRDELVRRFGLGGMGVLSPDGNCATVAMQFLIKHRRPVAKDRNLFRRWLFTMLFSTYYTGGGTESKVDDDLALMSARSVDWTALLRNASHDLRERGVVKLSSCQHFTLEHSMQFWLDRKNRVYLEALRRLTLANTMLLGWNDPAIKFPLGDKRGSLHHVFPRKPRGTRRMNMGQDVIEHPGNHATIDGEVNSSFNNKPPHEYLSTIPAAARQQQHIPPRRYWRESTAKQFWIARTRLIVRAAETKVRKNAW